MKKGFTLAECLITLGVIGIVAAITVPMLRLKIEEKRTQIKLKKFYSVLAQATRQSIAENDEMSGWNTSLSGVDFYDTYYAKYLKTLHRYNSRPDWVYVRFMDGTCAKFRKNNSSRTNIDTFYWGIDTTCGKGPQMEGVTLFDLCVYNLIEAPIFCAAGQCKWRTDADYAYNMRWAGRGGCPATSSGYGWKGYECYLKFINNGFMFTKGYSFSKVKRAYSKYYSKPLNDSSNYWLKKGN